jgi:hypothetical protein
MTISFNQRLFKFEWSCSADAENRNTKSHKLLKWSLINLNQLLDISLDLYSLWKKQYILLSFKKSQSFYSKAKNMFSNVKSVSLSVINVNFIFCIVASFTIISLNINNQSLSELFHVLQKQEWSVNIICLQEITKSKSHSKNIYLDNNNSIEMLFFNRITDLQVHVAVLSLLTRLIIFQTKVVIKSHEFQSCLMSA